MMQINAMGDVCPIPVIKTKKALAEMATGQLEILVDNAVAVENIRQLAATSGCAVAVSGEKGHFVIALTKEEGHTQQESTSPAPTTGKTIVVLSSQQMGEGDEALGELLMKGFVFALTQLDVLPDTVLLYNGGAKLAIQNAPTLQDLQTLEQAGVQVLTCGTCLTHFGIVEQLGVGEVTNMYQITKEMAQAGRVLRP